MNFDELVSRYAIKNELQFVAIEPGFVNIKIKNTKAHATISTYAGQILSYKPNTEQNDMLFISNKAYREDGKAIRGGIPVCWPWFGDDPEGQGRAAHGFARNRQWQVTATESLSNGATKIALGLANTDETRTIWPHSFQLAIEITVGESLEVKLLTRNIGKQSFAISQALHAYFLVGDIHTVRVLGLDGLDYIDKVDGFAKKTQAGPVTIDKEVDRIYTGETGKLVIDDAAYRRTIHITSAGSSAAVVWNPWATQAASMGDLGDDDYTKMICVEIANVGPETIDIPAGGEYCLAAEYSIER